MISFNKAKELCNQGKFQEAYDIYIELGKIFGENIVKYNLETLKKKVKNSRKYYSL